MAADPEAPAIAVGAAPALEDEGGRVAMVIGVLDPLPLPLPAAELAAFWVEAEFDTLFWDAELAVVAAGAGENA